MIAPVCLTHGKEWMELGSCMACEEERRVQAEEKHCPQCGKPVDDDGNALPGYEACYYCPHDGICNVCGSGECDQSC